MGPDALPDPVSVAIHFTGLLETLEVPHLVAGSLASSIHGEPRSTNDIDVLADLRDEHLDAFVAAAESEYVVSRGAVEEALRVSGSFNAIHRSAAVKVDVFIAGSDDFEQERLARRERVRIGGSPDAFVHVDTAEHTVLRKLEWYRRGGEVSERQWRDVVSILRTQGGRLHRGRLDAWAGRLGVTDLLERVRAEAGERPNP